MYVMTLISWIELKDSQILPAKILHHRGKGKLFIVRNQGEGCNHDIQSLLVPSERKDELLSMLQQIEGTAKDELEAILSVLQNREYFYPGDIDNQLTA